MNIAIPIFALVTGVLTGSVFAALEAQIPPAQNLAVSWGFLGSIPDLCSSKEAS